MRLLLPTVLIFTTVFSKDPVNHPSYTRLLGYSHFTNKTEIEKFILNLLELKQLQNIIDGQPEPASDFSGQSFLDAVGNSDPSKPEMLPYLYEGDIILTEKQMNKKLSAKRIQALFKKSDRTPPVKRSLTSDLDLRWDLPIRYWVDPNAGISDDVLQASIDMWSELTCVSFDERRSPPHRGPYLAFAIGEDRGCYSYVGNEIPDGPQVISIDHKCNSIGIISHEIGHALGLWHEQSRPERDDYITVEKKNIEHDKQTLDQFIMESKSDAVNYGVRYDYASIMHYGDFAFSKHRYNVKGEETIKTNDKNYQNTIGQREGPSFSDVKQINFAYCNSTCKHHSKLECQNGGYQDPKNCDVCRCPTGLGGKFCDQVQPSLSPKICGHTDLTATINTQQVAVDRDTECYYRITAPPGRKVVVNFTAFRFPKRDRERGEPCAGSYAEVKYRANPVPSGARVCGRSSHRRSNPSFVSEGRTVFVFFKSSRGFDSSLSFEYRFDPAEPVEPTTTLQPWITETTTSPPWISTTSATPICQWSACTAICGGCGTQTRQCLGRTTTRRCAFTPCPGKQCCSPFKCVIDGVCSRVKNEFYENSEPEEQFCPEETIDANNTGFHSPIAAGTRPLPAPPIVEGSGEESTSEELENTQNLDTEGVSVRTEGSEDVAGSAAHSRARRFVSLEALPNI